MRDTKQALTCKGICLPNRVQSSQEAVVYMERKLVFNSGIYFLYDYRLERGNVFDIWIG